MKRERWGRGRGGAHAYLKFNSYFHASIDWLNCVLNGATFSFSELPPLNSAAVLEMYGARRESSRLPFGMPSAGVCVLMSSASHGADSWLQAGRSGTSLYRRKRGRGGGGGGGGTHWRTPGAPSNPSLAWNASKARRKVNIMTKLFLFLSLLLFTFYLATLTIKIGTCSTGVTWPRGQPRQSGIE